MVADGRAMVGDVVAYCCVVAVIFFWHVLLLHVVNDELLCAIQGLRMGAGTVIGVCSQKSPFRDFLRC